MALRIMCVLLAVAGPVQLAAGCAADDPGGDAMVVLGQSTGRGTDAGGTGGRTPEGGGGGASGTGEEGSGGDVDVAGDVAMDAGVSNASEVGAEVRSGPTNADGGSEPAVGDAGGFGDTGVDAGSEPLLCDPGSLRCAPDEPLWRQRCRDDGAAWDSAACAVEVAGAVFCTGEGECSVCQLGAQRCADAGQLERCDAEGAWTAGQACPDSQPECWGGMCRAVCSAGETRCAPGVDVAVEACGPAGGWALAQACDAALETFEVCRAGACVPSELQTLGGTTADSWPGEIELAPHTWHLSPLVVTEAMRVVELGVYLNDVAELASLRLALWDDVSGVDGPHPGKIATWSPRAANEGPGWNESTIPRRTVLEPGLYWLGVNFSKPARVPVLGDGAWVFYDGPEASLNRDVNTSLAEFPAVELPARWLRLPITLRGKAAR